MYFCSESPTRPTDVNTDRELQLIIKMFWIFRALFRVFRDIALELQL